MAPAYKLTYFNGRGIVEGARFLFKYGDIDFEDVRIDPADIPQLKEKAPFGQFPILEHNGKMVGQSIAITRYVAKLAKLAGNDDWENLEIDAVVDTINDLRMKLGLVNHEIDEERKKTMKETALKETIPYYLTRLEAIVQKNKGYLVLGRLTWADMYIASIAPSFDRFTGDDALVKYPNLKALIDKVNALPAIKKWIEVRPKTEF